MRSDKNNGNLTLFGKRLRAIRENANLSQEQIRDLIGIGQSHLVKIEAGTLSVGIHYVSRFAELFGVEDYELFQYKAPIPDADLLKKNVSKYLKGRKIDPAVFLKESLVHLIETKLLPSKFFSSPRFTREISEFLEEKDGTAFSTSHISQALNGFVRKGKVERLKTDIKTKYQYRSKA